MPVGNGPTPAEAQFPLQLVQQREPLEDVRKMREIAGALRLDAAIAEAQRRPGHARFRVPLQILDEGCQRPFVDHRIRIQEDHVASPAQAQRPVVAGRKSDVFRRRENGHLREIAPHHFHRPVARCAIDDEDLHGDLPGLHAQGLQAVGQQLLHVVADDHHREFRARSRRCGVTPAHRCLPRPSHWAATAMTKRVL